MSLRQRFPSLGSCGRILVYRSDRALRTEDGIDVLPVHDLLATAGRGDLFEPR